MITFQGFVVVAKLWGNHYYNYKGELDGDCLEQIKEFTLSKKENRKVNSKYDNIEAPTQSLLQKWLREVHKIDVYIVPDIPGFTRSNPKYYVRYFECSEKCILNKPKKIMHKPGYEKYWVSPEEALEVGLQEALKLIK